jgi:hypothetical protein
VSNVLYLDIINSQSFYPAVHHSFDSIVENDDSNVDISGQRSPSGYSPEALDDFLAQITSRDAPNHELHLKIGAVCSIMRNLSSAKGLVKNQRVVIVRITARYIEVRLLNRGHRPDTTHCIPRIMFDFRPSYVSYTVRRRQFPLRLAYSTTFNSCQGLTFDSVVIDGRTDVFAHGQLYTALSRVRNRADAWVYLPDDRPDVANVVYKNLLM